MFEVCWPSEHCSELSSSSLGPQALTSFGQAVQHCHTCNRALQSVSLEKGFDRVRNVPGDTRAPICRAPARRSSRKPMIRQESLCRHALLHVAMRQRWRLLVSGLGAVGLDLREGAGVQGCGIALREGPLATSARSALDAWGRRFVCASMSEHCNLLDAGLGVGIAVVALLWPRIRRGGVDSA